MTASQTVTARNLYADLGKLNARIDAFAKSGTKLQTEAHKLACSVLLHLAKNKDTRVLHRLILGMPEMVRTNGLRAWFETFGAVKFISDADHPESPEQIFIVKDKQVMLADAMAKPFWKFVANEGKPYEPVDFKAEIQRLMEKLGKDTAKTGRNYNAEIKALRAIISPAGVMEPVRKPEAFDVSQATVDPLAAIQ